MSGDFTYIKSGHQCELEFRGYNDGSLYVATTDQGNRVNFSLSPDEVSDLRNSLNTIVQPEPDDDLADYYRRQATILALLKEALGIQHSLRLETANAIIGLAWYIERGGDALADRVKASQS